MTEVDAQDWIRARFGEAGHRSLAELAAAVIAENDRQNLISRETVPVIWNRHLVDSAQLLPLAGDDWKTWADIGTGAGFPGMVVALLSSKPIVLIEPRRRRADFLAALAERFGIASRVSTVCVRVERISRTATDIISARAVASIDSLFEIAQPLTTPATRFILSRGRDVRHELERARQSWHGVFHVEPSVTNLESGIVVATGVRRQ